MEEEYQSLHNDYVRKHGKILNLDNFTEPIPKKMLKQKFPNMSQFDESSKKLKGKTRGFYNKL